MILLSVGVGLLCLSSQMRCSLIGIFSEKRTNLHLMILQETIKRQVSSMYHWPQVLEIPILDAST